MKAGAMHADGKFGFIGLPGWEVRGYRTLKPRRWGQDKTTGQRVLGKRCFVYRVVYIDSFGLYGQIFLVAAL